jgi:hypothetical protein
MLLGVSGRVVQTKKRLETLQCLLRNIAFLFLRFISNNDRNTNSIYCYS